MKVVSILGTPSHMDWPEGLRMAEHKGVSFPQMNPTPLSQIITGREISHDAIDLL